MGVNIYVDGIITPTEFYGDKETLTLTFVLDLSISFLLHLTSHLSPVASHHPPRDLRLSPLRLRPLTTPLPPQPVSVPSPPHYHHSPVSVASPHLALVSPSFSPPSLAVLHPYYFSLSHHRPTCVLRPRLLIKKVKSF